LLGPNLFIDIAVVGKKVVDFYAAKGGEVVSPLVKAL
jgi:transketolase